MSVDLRVCALSVGLFAVSGCTAFLPVRNDGRIPLAACTWVEDAPAIQAAGFDAWEWTVSSALMPDKSDAEWAPVRAKILAAPIPLVSCNGFIPGRFSLSNPLVSHDEPLAYAEKACRRADAIGLKYIVFGSGGARRIPDDVDPDVGRARFISFCRALAVRIADCKVTIVLEPLNRREVNLLNTVADGIGMVDAIGSPRFRLLADLFHMAREHEGPESIRRAGPRLCHVHIAEAANRTWPGVDGDDFTPYFKALRDIGYQGCVSIEASLPAPRPEEVPALRAKCFTHLDHMLNH